MAEKYAMLAGVMNNLKTGVSCGQEKMVTVCTRIGKLEKESAECKDGVTSVLEKHSDLVEVVSGLKSVCNHEENEARIGELEAKSVVLKEQIDKVTQTNKNLTERLGTLEAKTVSFEVNVGWTRSRNSSSFPHSFNL